MNLFTDNLYIYIYKDNLFMDPCINDYYEKDRWTKDKMRKKY